jgi:hypothetical protein
VIKQDLNIGTYIGPVVDNLDPERLGRVRVRAINVYDSIPVEAIPWATPWRDLNGNSAYIPELGKMLTVVFDKGNKYKPEFICAEHYNYNLEQKLSTVSEDDYKSMRVLLFDHLTQIYVNNSEGLKIDHKFNNINIIESGINLNLKDNSGKLKLGDGKAEQQIILGNNFFDWFDTLMDIMQSSPYLGNLGAPVVANPALLTVIAQYKALKIPKFLSRNVYANDNFQINYIKQQTGSDANLRPNFNKVGDEWDSTIQDNELSQSLPTINTPQEGTGAETPVNNEIVPDENPFITKIKKIFTTKGYTLNENVGYLNIIAVRLQTEGLKYSNNFIDRIILVWKSERNVLEYTSGHYTTIAGLYVDGTQTTTLKDFSKLNSSMGIPHLVPGQYINNLRFDDTFKTEDDMTIEAKPIFTSFAKQLVYYDNVYETDVITYGSNRAPVEVVGLININRGYPGGQLVNNWSSGSHAVSDGRFYDEMCELAKKHCSIHGNVFNYTLILSSDLAA